MKKFMLFAFSFLTCMSGFSQNLIGYNAKMIKKYMKENCREMNIWKVSNDRFTYLKYSDITNRQTLLFFLSSDSVCKSERMIIDFSLKTEKVKEFNSLYRKTEGNRWVDTHNGKDFLIDISDETWTSVITIVSDK